MMGRVGTGMIKIMKHYIYFFKQMEKCELTDTEIIGELGNYSHKRVCKTIISYLSLEDLAQLNQQLQNTKPTSAFAQLIRLYYFLNSYLFKIDRTFYYNFYEHPDFLEIQNSHLTLLADQCSNNFLTFPKKFKTCLTFIHGLLPEEASPETLVEELDRILTDTSIPLPKLKRENHGIFCKTSFQNFLVDLKYNQDSPADYFSPFEQIESYFQSQEQKYLQKLFLRAAKDPSINLKVRSLRFTPFQIDFHNFQSFLVQKNSLHNLLVGVYTITDILISSFQEYIGSLQDPFHRFVELITRYSIFRNYVIEIQENLAFAFEQYDQLYSQVFGCDKPKYRFWRGAMTKWLLKFSKYHQECNLLYYYCLTKVRMEEMLVFLDDMKEQDPTYYMQITNQAHLREYQLTINELAKPNNESNGVEEYFQNNKEQYQVLLIEYVEYMVDLSINEETVHWCGHSEQPLSEPYLTFEKSLLTENKSYLNYIRSLQGLQKSKRFQREYFTLELDLLERLQIKSLTLKKVLQCYNLELSDFSTLSQGFEGVNYDFHTKDETLNYFNQKGKIKFIIAQEQMCFYSIMPLVSANELLTKSISTAEGSDHGESQKDSECEMEYLSQSSELEDYEFDLKEEGEIKTLKQCKENKVQLSMAGESTKEKVVLHDDSDGHEE